MTDILERLSRDAGALTFREPIEDRVRAAEEIRRLRSDVAAMKTRWAVRSARPEPERRSQEAAEVGLNPSRLVRLRDLRGIVGLSRLTIYRMVNEGRLPRPVKLSTHASAWRMGDVLAWQDGLGD
jgi:prophage regulatory protein